jgi:hypothetical protein
MQYITCCLCFSISKPFRKPIWTNPLYLGSVVFMLIYQNYLILGYDDWSYDLFGLVELPTEFKIRLFVLCLINSLCSYVYEKFFIGWFNRYYQKNQKSNMARKQKEYIEALQNQRYSQKGVIISNNIKLRDSEDNTIANMEESMARCIISRTIEK